MDNDEIEAITIIWNKKDNHIIHFGNMIIFDAAAIIQRIIVENEKKKAIEEYKRSQEDAS